MEKLALETLAELRRSRRWRIALSLGWLSFFFLLLFAVMGWTGGKRDVADREPVYAIQSDNRTRADRCALHGFVLVNIGRDFPAIETKQRWSE